MDTNTSSEEILNPLSDTGYLCVGIYLIFLGISSVCCNGFVIFVLLKGDVKHNVMHNILLLNMAITDFFISVVAYPLSASSSIQGRWIFSEETCTFYGFWVFTLAMANMNTLAVIAICRYIVAVQQKYNYLLVKKNAKYFLLVIWIYSILWTGPPLLGWSSYTFEAYGTSCTINWAGRSILDKTYNVTITFTCYIGHVIICCYSYFHVIKRYMWARNSDFGVALRSTDVNRQEPEETFNLETVVSYHKITTSRKVTMMCITMLTSYILAWTPYTLLSLWVMFIGDVQPWLHVFPTLMAKSSTLSNAIVYGILSSKFRESIKRLFKRKRTQVVPTHATIHRSPAEPTATSSRVHPTATQPRERIKKEQDTYRTYSVHLVRNDVYIGKNKVTLPNEEQVL